MRDFTNLIMEKKNTDHLPVLEGIFTVFPRRCSQTRIYDDETFQSAIREQIQRNRDKKIDILLDVTNTNDL